MRMEGGRKREMGEREREIERRKGEREREIERRKGEREREKAIERIR